MHRVPAKLLLFGAAALAACNRLPAGAVAVGSIAISDANLSGVPELGLPGDRVRRELQMALEKTRHFALREGAAGRVRLEIEAARRLAGPEREVADVELLVELTAPTPQGDLERTVSEGAGRAPTGSEAGAGSEARLAAFDGALRAALDDAARGLAWQLDAHRKTEPELVRDLQDPDARAITPSARWPTSAAWKSFRSWSDGSTTRTRPSRCGRWGRWSPSGTGARSIRSSR